MAILMDWHMMGETFLPTFNINSGKQVEKLFLYSAEHQLSVGKVWVEVTSRLNSVMFLFACKTVDPWTILRRIKATSFPMFP